MLSTICGEIMAHEIESERVRDLLKINPKGLTIEEVARKLNVNHATAAKHLNSLLLSGQADRRALGPAKLFSPIHRLTLTTMISLSSDFDHHHGQGTLHRSGK